MINTFSLHTAGLAAELNKLKSKQSLTRLSGFFTRLFEAYFLMLVVSFFIGFLQMFPIDDFGGSMPRYISYFMYFVLGLVVIIISNSRIKSMIGERRPDLVQNKMLVNVLTVLFGAAILIAGYFLGTNFLGDDFGVNFMLRWAGGIFSIFVLLIPYFLLKKIESQFNQQYKEILIPQFISASGLPVKWKGDEFLSRDDFINSGLFTYENIYTYNGSDLFSENAFHFRGSRLIVQQREVKSSSGKTEVKISEVFNGYLFAADFNKPIHGETFIFPDQMRSILGEVYGEMANEWITRKGAKMVMLEDRDFEKRFAVYASDDVEARYILSPKLIERINMFSENFYQDILISFIGNTVYVAIATKNDIARPNLYGNLADEKYIAKQLQHLHAMLSIPEEFDLGTKIWG